MALQVEDLGSRWETFFQEVKLQEIQQEIMCSKTLDEAGRNMTLKDLK